MDDKKLKVYCHLWKSIWYVFWAIIGLDVSIRKTIMDECGKILLSVLLKADSFFKICDVIIK